jgi:hypothetical protein
MSLENIALDYLEKARHTIDKGDTPHVCELARTLSNIGLGYAILLVSERLQNIKIEGGIGDVTDIIKEIQTLREEQKEAASHVHS